MNDEIKSSIIDKGHYTEVEYPFKIKPNFSTLGSIVENEPQGALVGFVFDDSIGILLGFHETILWEDYNISQNPVVISSFDNTFIHTDIVQGMIFKCKRSGKKHKFTMDVDPGYRFIEKFRDGLQWYVMDNKGFISSINIKLKNENGEIVSFKGQSITFRLSIKEV